MTGINRRKTPQVVLVLLVLVAACSGPAASATSSPPAALAASGTPSIQVPVEGCSSPAALTAPMTEGPYFMAGSPEQTSLLEPGMPGTQLVLSGSVLDENCQPVAGALLDFWQANADGQYDNLGYTLRGHQYSDAAGHYQLTTVVPGLYPGRTEHIHVKVQAPDGPVLTTQLFFPGVAQNQTDGIFDPSLVIQVTGDSGGLTATFDFFISTH
jgi:protocatechuate 3,4-dioxygenase beta subunit